MDISNPFDNTPDAPVWLAEALKKPVRTPGKTPPGFEEDNKYALEQAEWEIRNNWVPTPMVAGENRDQTTVRIFARMHGIGLSIAAAREMYELFIKESGSPYPDGYPGDYKTGDKIRRIWDPDGVFSEPGSERHETPAEAFRDVVRIPRPRFYLEKPSLLEESPPITYWDSQLDNPVLPKCGGMVGMMVGAWESYKTFIMLAQTLAAEKKPKVLYVNGEGGPGFGQRLRALRLFYDLTHEERDARFQRCPMPILHTELGEFDKFLESSRSEFRPDIIVFDTLAAGLVGLSDNDDVTAQLLTENGGLGKIADKYGVLCYVLHHTTKEKVENIEAVGGRGSGGWFANSSIVQACFHEKESEFVQTRRIRYKEGVTGPRTDQFYRIEKYDDTPVTVAVSREIWRQSEKPIEFGSVRNSLAGIGADTEDKGVNSNQLAMHMFPKQDGDDSERWTLAINDAVRRLDKDKSVDAFHNGAKPRKWWIK